MTIKPRTNLIMDTIILVLLVAVLVSGLLVWLVYPQGGTRAGGRYNARSSAAEPVLGVDKHDMVAVHTWAGLGMGLLVLVHLAFHWKWITCQVGRLLGRKPVTTRRSRSCPENGRL
jgi:hypothetical protein